MNEINAILDDLADTDVMVDELWEQAAQLQSLISNGHWSLEGSTGRAMMAALEEGYCILGKSDARDYWGHHIPSRDQVEDGTKGSYQYVADRFGTDWADKLIALEEK